VKKVVVMTRLAVIFGVALVGCAVAAFSDAQATRKRSACDVEPQKRNESP